MSGGIGTDRLTDARVRAWVRKAQDGTAATKKLSDGRGLYLTLTNAGTPAWRLKYRLATGERLLAIGLYPEVGIKEARARRDDARKLLAEGVDPVQAKRERKAANLAQGEYTLRAAIDAYLEHKAQEWAPGTLRKEAPRLRNDIPADLMARPLERIKRSELVAVVRAIGRNAGRETAAKVAMHLGAAYTLSVNAGDLPQDANAAWNLASALPKAKKPTPHAALESLEGLGDILRAVDAAPISPAVRLAHKLLAYSGSRVSPVVEAEWREFDLDAAAPTWTIPRDKQKVKDRTGDHRIYLGPTIAADLRWWRQVTGGKGHVFMSPHRTGERLTPYALNRLYLRTLAMGKRDESDRHSLHGWRASMRTLASRAGFSYEACELALDHEPRSKIVRAYERDDRYEERQRLAEWWDAQLTAAQSPEGGRVLPMRRAGAA
ncbi:MAG: integrase arm-type DNA-binding domain-containing protein [Gemmatimonadetes bacterium]|nr:integrase arm-type DNA-binding domain-containing protein [Gemmatimonadota bacterium]